MAVVVLITKVVNNGDDTLTVVGTVDPGDGTGPHDVTARGWASAMTNYHPPADYNPDGTIKAGAVARPMSKAERLAYCQGLLRQAAGVPVAVVSDITATVV